MGILSLLLSGKRIKFMSTDIDKYQYDENSSKLLQIIDDEMTGFEISVIEVNEIFITTDWGDESTSTLFEDELIFVD
jgi:hypothetical protein